MTMTPDHPSLVTRIAVGKALGALVGLAPESALAISLAIRLREVLIDVPGLILWQHAEGRALFWRRKEAGNTQSME